MLNIGLFNDSYPPIIDGVAITVQNYAYWLNDQGNKACVITPKAPDYPDTDPFPVYRYPSFPLISRKPYRVGIPDIDLVFQAKIEKIPFSLVHAHCPFTSGLLALKVAKERNIPFVASFHTKYRDNFEQTIHSKRLINLMVKEVVYFYNHADEVWIPQESVEETIREYGYKGKLVVMNNGNDFSTDEKPESLKQKARENLGIPEDETVFLYVGQLVWEKNIKLIVESLTRLTNKKFRMYFVGTGYAVDDLKSLAKDLHIREQLHFPGMIADRNILKDYYAAANLFIFPSLYDTWALVVREAAALYTPSLMIEEATAAKSVTDGFNGYLSKNTPEALSGKLEQLSSDKTKLLRTGVNASKTLTKSWEKVTEEVAERYRQVIEYHQKK